MELSKKIRVLVVDDSIFFRELLIKGLNEDKFIEVVGYASDPYMARDKIIELRPDVMTLDINMPKMSGIEFLRKLMPQYPMPVVVVSGVNDVVFEALEAGAVEFVEKPSKKNPDSMEILLKELKKKIKIASHAKISRYRKPKLNLNRMESKTSKKNEIIAIGASTGGTEAIYEIIKYLPTDTAGIVIVQHMPPVFTRMYADRLNLSCMMEVKEASDGDEVSVGKVLIAPGDKQMEVYSSGGKNFVRCYEGEKVSGHCPSVDVLFSSVAKLKLRKVVGVILTGMGKDGAKGLKEIYENYGVTIGQDEASCIVYGMPKIAYEMGAVKFQLPLREIAGKIIQLM